MLIGSGALITDNHAHPLHPSQRSDSALIAVRPVVVEQDVFIGARAIVLKGVRIGCGAIVGAGAVVTRDVPAMGVVAGNPAREVRTSPSLCVTESEVLNGHGDG